MSSTPRKAPTPLRIPESWEAEIETARKRQQQNSSKPVSKHSWLLKAIRRVLDGEPKIHCEEERK